MRKKNGATRGKTRREARGKLEKAGIGGEFRDWERPSIGGYLARGSVCFGRAKILGKGLDHCWSLDF